jgi:hypothetical protein
MSSSTSSVIHVDNSKQQKWVRFDLGPIWLRPIWLGADFAWGRFDLLPKGLLR